MISIKILTKFQANINQKVTKKQSNIDHTSAKIRSKIEQKATPNREQITKKLILGGSGGLRGGPWGQLGPKRVPRERKGGSWAIPGGPFWGPLGDILEDFAALFSRCFSDPPLSGFGGALWRQSGATGLPG